MSTFKVINERNKRNKRNQEYKEAIAGPDESKVKKINKTKVGFVNFKVLGPYHIPRRKEEGIVDALPAGIYSVDVDEHGQLLFYGIGTMSDDLLDLPDTPSETILKEVNHFWGGATKDKFAKYGLIHKRGILMFGKQGCSKTATVIQVMEKVVAEGGLVFFGVKPALVSKAIEAVREIQPDVKVLLVYEELDAWLAGDTHSMLSLLDGELQVDNFVVLATTNYISRVPARIKNRPSRFATVIEMSAPSDKAREVYFSAKLTGVDRKRIPELVKKTKDFTIDQLKDIIISVFCFDWKLDVAIKKIKEMEKDSMGDDDYQESLKKDRYKDSAIDSKKKMGISLTDREKEREWNSDLNGN